MTSMKTLSCGLVLTASLALAPSGRDAVLPMDAVRDRATFPAPSNGLADGRIQVLNVATFHMGTTSDAHGTAFDEQNERNQAAARDVARRLSAFAPTIVCVEVPREEEDELAAEYEAWLARPDEPSTWYGEVGLVAFEIARQAGLDRLHGIDHKLSYNYGIAQEIENAIDPDTLARFGEDPFALWPELRMDEDALSLREKLRHINRPEFLDFLIAVNADMLALAGTEDGFEGADEAARYYQRNLRIYSNLNRIPMTADDRVLILSGGSHTAFLGEFLQRSPKFALVDTGAYL